MQTTGFSFRLRSLLLGVALLLSAAARAQSAAPAPQGYDFLTVTAAQSNTESGSKIVFIPSFQGKTEISLETISAWSNLFNQERFRKNTTLINQQLSALTVEGWELVQVLPTPNLYITGYLFRKAKP